MWFILFFVVIAVAAYVIDQSKKYPERFSINKSGEPKDSKKNSHLSFNIMVVIMAVIFYFGIGFWINELFFDHKSESHPLAENLQARSNFTQYLSIQEFISRMNKALKDGGNADLQIESLEPETSQGYRVIQMAVSDAVEMIGFLDEQDHVKGVTIMLHHSAHPGINLALALDYIYAVSKSLNPDSPATDRSTDVMQMADRASTEYDKSSIPVDKSFVNNGFKYGVHVDDSGMMFGFGAVQK